MRLSQLFFKNHSFEKQNENLDLTELMKKACYIHQDASGLYSTLTLGLALQRAFEELIREEMLLCGFGEVELSILQDTALWRQTNRIESYGEELFRLKDRKNHEYCLSATAEELMTSIVKNHYQSTKIEVNVFQFGQKYRDEMRARGGLIRAKQFVMKDAYSFSSSETQSIETYEKVKKAYERILKFLGFEYIIKASDNGEIGGKSSEEFLIKSAYAQGLEKDNWLEVAHIFQLGQEYSQKMNLVDNTKSYVYMNCYGIGVSRLFMVWCEQHRDKFGFFGTDSFSTFDKVISALDYHRNDAVRELAEKTYQNLLAKGYRVLLDDRAEVVGKKLSDSELIGVNERIIISQQGIEKNQFEVLKRQTMEKRFLTLEELFLI